MYKQTKKYFQQLTMAAVVLTLSTVAHAEKRLDHGQAAKLLQDYAAQMNSLRTNFVQLIKDQNGKELRRQSGVLDIKKPDKFYLHYQTPATAEQFIIGNGKLMWVYNVDLEEASAREVDDSVDNSPVALLLRGDNLDSRYLVHDLGTVNEQRIIELSSRQNKNFGKALLVFDRANQLKLMSLQDQLGQVTELSFSDTKINPQLDNKHFEFVAPKGVYVSGGK